MIQYYSVLLTYYGTVLRIYMIVKGFIILL